MTHPFSRLVADNDQDRAACEEWWRDASEEDRLAVPELVMELMSRFAQLALAEAVERAEGGDHAR